MTDTQKEQILKLRAEGIGYIKIAKEIGISENTVKSFCRRNAKAAADCELLSADEDLQKHFCLQCGIEVEQAPGRKLKKFCSDKCRMKWWNDHADQINRHKTHRYKCVGCGREFEVYGTGGRKYCSHACYIQSRFYGGGGSND